MPRRLKKHESGKQTARTVKRRLTLLSAILITILLVLLFGVGEAQWLGWVSSHRTQIVGSLSLAIILLILLSPIMMEASSNPRVLSGSGKNPRGPRLE
jgi:hypothetical protein